MTTTFAKSDITDAVTALAKEVSRRANRRETTAEDLLNLTLAMRQATETMAVLDRLG